MLLEMRHRVGGHEREAFRIARLHQLFRVEIFLESGKDFGGFLRLAAQVGNGIGDGVVVFQTEQRVQFALVQFLHAFGDVVLEDEIEEGLLPGVEGGIDMNPRMVGAHLAGHRWNDARDDLRNGILGTVASEQAHHSRFAD